jgi:hypothetical protein
MNRLAYITNFEQMGVMRDHALVVIFGVCAVFVLSYLAIGWYQKFIPVKWVWRARGLLLVAFAIFYAASWFAYLLQ